MVGWENERGPVWAKFRCGKKEVKGGIKKQVCLV